MLQGVLIIKGGVLDRLLLLFAGSNRHTTVACVQGAQLLAVLLLPKLTAPLYYYFPSAAVRLPARMHFWLLQALLSLPMSLLGSTVPRNTGLNWFIPALVNRRVGSFRGTCSHKQVSRWRVQTAAGLLPGVSVMLLVATHAAWRCSV